MSLDSHERKSTPLELIHSDISGPFPRMSMSQDKYALTFIDDFSRYFWVYFLKHKSEVFDLFKVFKALVENHFGRRLKILRSENGGEYVKYEFIQYCEDACIRCSTLFPTHLTRMVLLRGRIDLSRRWLLV